jgi:CHAT domain-containing protein
MKLSKVSCTESPPRIWWCVTGPLAFLPVHAAGIYDNFSTPNTNIFDYVVSSYTPTLSALIFAAENHEASQEFRGLLAVSQPNTPGQSAIPNTMVELTQIQKQGHDCSVDVLEGPEALVESVVKGMQSHSWVHLACHAVQDAAVPTRSALLLHNGPLELSTIITKSFPNADFAFLSACQTATGDEKLSEEAAHLAAGFMFSGYRSVIATMWSIKDDDAPVITDHVYSHLFDAELDSTQAAVALHRAVKALRLQVGDSAFLQWVPFVHMGI